MMLKVTLLTLTSLSMSLIIAHVPLTMGLMVFSMALISLSLISIMTTTWLALALFLIYIGGMLVLFAYFLAILPNQFLNMTLSSIFTLLSLTVMGLNEHMLLLVPQSPSNSYSIHLIISNQNTHIIITLVLILLMVLIISVKLTTIMSGPLRPFSS